MIFTFLVTRLEDATIPANPASVVAHPPNLHRIDPLDIVVVLASLVLTWATLYLLSNADSPESYQGAFLTWAVACIIYAVAFMPRRLHWDWRAWLGTNRVDIVLALGLTAAAALLRFVFLGSVPDIISGDEGVIGRLALSAARGEMPNLFATTYGHSTLYVNLMGWGIAAFGANPFGLRLTSAVSGVLTVPALYLLAHRMFDRRVAVIASGLLAVSHFHVHFSRVIVAGSLQDAFLATLTLWLFYEGLRQRRAALFVLSALTLSLHLYIYMGGRLLSLLIPIYLGVLAIVRGRLVRANVANLFAFAGASIISAAPMALWALQYPDEFNARANQIGIFQSGWLAYEMTIAGQPGWLILVRQILEAFLTVNYYPVDAFYHSTYPMLDFVAAIFFVLGIGYSSLYINDERHLLLHGWFWSGLLVGGALLVLPSLAAYRILIVFPAVAIFVALGVAKTITLAERALHPPPFFANAMIAVFMLVCALLNFKAYWVDWAPLCKYEDLPTRFASQMGTYLSRQPRNSQVILLGEPFIHYGIHQSIDFLSGQLSVADLWEPLTAPPDLDVDRSSPIIFVFAPVRMGDLAYVQQAFPNGNRVEIKDCNRVSLIVYQVNAP